MTARLEECAVLVTLTISEWTGRKYDRKVSDDVAFDYKADKSVGRYNKSLLAPNSYLSAVHAKTVGVRKVFAENTLPWGIEGTHILPNKNFMKFAEIMREQKRDWYDRVDDFVRSYPRLKLEAQRYLPNGLYREADYPLASEIRSKFKLDIATFPVPSSDFRVQLGELEKEELSREVEERVLQATHSAMQEVWNRLYSTAKKITDKLHDPSAIFRDSLIENAKEVCALLPRLNLSNDPDLEQMRSALLKSVTGEHPDTLRNDLAVRKKTHDEVEAIMRRMGAFMGGEQ